MAPPLLQLDDLHVAAGDQEILRGVDLSLGEGELHVLLGASGSGKSALARTLLGHPAYRVTGGRVRFKGEDITAWPTDVRGKAGIFLAFQHPEDIPGVAVTQLLRQALSARKGVELPALELRASIREWMARLGIDAASEERFSNGGFCGDDGGRSEILQLAVLEPELAVLDGTDPGSEPGHPGALAAGLGEVRRARPALGVLVVTRHGGALDGIRPDVVHLLVQGRVVAEGGPELARRLEEEGYEAWQ